MRTETGIGENAVSISYAAVELAKKVFDTLEGRTILVRRRRQDERADRQAPREPGRAQVLVANRTYERAVELAEKFEGTAIPYDDLFARMREADIVISSTSAPGYVIDKAKVAGVMKGRRAAAVPHRHRRPARHRPGGQRPPQRLRLRHRRPQRRRAVQPRGAHARGASAPRSSSRRRSRRSRRWLESLEVVPTIAAIRAEAESIRQAELEKAIKRLGGLSEKELATVEALSQAIVNKMLHGPTARLRDAAAEKDGYAAVESARMLYGLDDRRTKKPHARSRGLRCSLPPGRDKPLGEDEREGDTVGC